MKLCWLRKPTTPNVTAGIAEATQMSFILGSMVIDN